MQNLMITIFLFELRRGLYRMYLIVDIEFRSKSKKEKLKREDKLISPFLLV